MRSINVVLAGASALVLASMATGAHAAQPAPTTTGVGDDAVLGEIVVTARRRTESLQEVPQVVNAITADTLQKLNIRDFRDIQSVVPGVALGSRNSNTSIRGVSFNSNTSANPTVAFYLNETPVQANHLFQVMFDVGQVEVLRGPQGTTRGVPAPSGAITVTTRRPDLGEFGGYIDLTATDLQRRAIQGAINVPIIRDVLGVRIAGIVDHNDYDGVNSVFSRLQPRQVNTAVRTSVSYEPSDVFNATVTWTHFDRTEESFVPVTGTGFAGSALIPGTPVIGLKDRVGVQDDPRQIHIHFDAVTAQIDSRLFGQHLQYIGGYSHQSYRDWQDQDTGQVLPRVVVNGLIDTSLENTSHEIRISSDPAPGRFLDYVAGVYYGWQENLNVSNSFQPQIFLPGAFGPLTAPNLALFNPALQIPRFIPTHSDNQDTSVYATVTLHLGDKTELTAGARHLWSQVTSDLKIFLGDPRGGAFPLALPCATFNFPVGPTPGTCLPTIVAQPPVRRFHEEHTIYNVSLKHRFTPDLMVYGSVGTAFRPAYASIGVNNARNDPVLAGLMVHPSEKSRSYEVGFKGTFLDGRARLNLALFRQKFRDMPTFIRGIPYASFATPALGTVQPFDFTADPNAIVEGFDVDAAFQITPNWSISGQLSYADGRATSDVPCNDSNFDGIPDAGRVTNINDFLSRGIFVALCPGGSVSQEPYWNTSITSEYVQPVRDNVDVYLRGLFTYYPKNARKTPATVIDNYSLLNLYAGLRANDGAWDVGLFVRNALNTKEITDLAVNPIGSMASQLAFYPALNHPSGYVEKDLTPRREFGVSVRYAFGSR